MRDADGDTFSTNGGRSYPVMAGPDHIRANLESPPVARCCTIVLAAVDPAISRHVLDVMAGSSPAMTSNVRAIVPKSGN